MLNKNKIARITLVLFMALNISVINSSIIKANPVDSSYYNPYSHGESFDKPRTFNANEESNSERKEREKREAEEAKKKAEEAKRQAQAEAEAEKAKQDASFPDASNGSEKVNHTGVLDTDSKNGIQKSKIDDFNYVNSDAYKDIAKAKCEKIAKEAVQKGSLLKANGERITDTNDICTEEALDQFTHCLAAYNAEGATPSNIDEQVLNECANNYVLVTRSTSTYDENEVGVLDRIKESLAEGFISTFSGVLPDSIVQAGAEIIREITWKDIAEEVAIAGGLTLLTVATGGAAGVALFARVAQFANKARRIINKAKIVNRFRSPESLKAIQEAEKLSSVEKDFVTKAKTLTEENVKNYEEALKAIKRKIDKGEGDFEIETLQKIGKHIKALNEEATHGGKSLVEIGQETKTKTSALQKEVSKINEQITKKEKLVSDLKEKTEKINPSNRKKIKEINKNKEIINKTQDEIQKLQLQNNQKLEEINEAKTHLEELKETVDATKVRDTLESINYTKKGKVAGIFAERLAVVDAIHNTGKVAYRTVYSNPNAHQTDVKVNQRTAEQYANEANDESLTSEQRNKAKNKAWEMQANQSKSALTLDKVEATVNSKASKISQGRADIDARSGK